MSNKYLIKSFFLAVTALIISSVSMAAPVWTFTPLTPTSVSVPINGSATVQYQVTNQSPVPHVLQLTPITGVTQTTTTGNCTHPFTLTAANPSCILTLEVSGLALESDISGGPRVCQEGPGGILSSVQCYQPSQNNSLSVERFIEHLTISPSNLTLTANGLPGSIVVTNHQLEQAASNVTADFTGTALEGNVTQNATDCVSLDPGKSCTLTFTPTSQAVSLSNFPIQGTNTRPVGASMSVTSSLTADIAITATSTSTSSSLLILQASSGTGTFTVQNNSTTTIATNITADLSGIPSVTVDARSCTSVAPGATCTLTFTAGAGADAIASTPVPVLGSNTSQVNGTIAVNGTVSLTVTSGSPLALQMNGNSGTMTVKNNSTTTTANDVTANFTNTALSGNVTASTCSSIAPSGTCSMTFSPGGTAVVQPTDFSISASNVSSTGTATGAISIGSFAYLTETGVNTVTLCRLNVDGTLGFCEDSGATGVPFSNSQGVAINHAKTIAYFTQQNSNIVTRCPINTNGSLGVCQDSGNTGVAFVEPIGIALNDAGTLAYVANYKFSGVSQCPINADGSLGACAYTGSGFSGGLAALALNTYPSSGTKAYVANYNANIISLCSVNAGTGALTGCVDSGAGPSVNSSQGIAFNPAGDKIYITSRNNNVLALCSVDSTSGMLTGCANTGSGFSGPSGVAVNNTGSWSYVANTDSKSIRECPVNSDGTLSGCLTLDLTQPSAIALLNG